MIRRWRLKKIRTRFLESCRNLGQARGYWQAESNGMTRLLEALSPVPLLGLHEDGAPLLQALDWLEDHCRSVPLREQELLHYHRTVYSGKGAGEYRRARMSVVDSRVPRPGPDRVPGLMRKLSERLVREQEEFDRAPSHNQSAVLRFALEIHQQIAYIHPFADGNGRVARLAMNHLLRRYGQGYVILPPVNESEAHFRAIEAAHRNDFSELTALALAHLHRV